MLNLVDLLRFTHGFAPYTFDLDVLLYALFRFPEGLLLTVCYHGLVEQDELFVHPHLHVDFKDAGL
jgi:hypothetical protein